MNRLTLPSDQNLHYFLAVAEEKNFARTAAKVHIEPSPLVRAIREMEPARGVYLNQQQAGRLRLARAGEKSSGTKPAACSRSWKAY
jgi:DNA-binding transcriptional LysR family regulator